MKQPPAISWLFKCALMAAVVLMADRLVAVAIGTKLQQPATTTRDGSMVTMNRYVQEPTPSLVLVGSSITWRLKEENFSLPGVRNLALAGGSPVTGLEIVAKQPELPKVVLVETNVLSRAVDHALVARFTGKESSETFLRPVRTAVAAYEIWNHAPPDPARMHAALEKLLSQPPSGFDNHAYVERAVREQNAEDPTLATRANVVLIRRLMTEIERRGTRVLLMEIPLASEIEQTLFARVTRQIVQEAFPDRSTWLKIEAPPAELRWADGLHLDERSALIVARAIEKALGGN